MELSFGDFGFTSGIAMTESVAGFSAVMEKPALRAALREACSAARRSVRFMMSGSFGLKIGKARIRDDTLADLTEKVTRTPGKTNRGGAEDRLVSD